MSNSTKKHYVVLSVQLVCVTVTGIVALSWGYEALAGTMLGCIIGGMAGDLQRARLARNKD